MVRGGMVDQPFNHLAIYYNFNHSIIVCHNVTVRVSVVRIQWEDAQGGVWWDGCSARVDQSVALSTPVGVREWVGCTSLIR